MQSTTLQHRHAFTLIELAIVIAIIGLVAGGVLGAQSMIRSAQVRAVATEFTQFQTAINQFRSQYNYWPGDIPNAVQYWGAQAGSATAFGGVPACSSLTSAQPATSQATCNGDGNGRITQISDGSGAWLELYRGWQHLANAGLIEGAYAGVQGPAGLSDHIAGWNAPRSRYGQVNAYWRISNTSGRATADSGMFAGVYGNILYFMGEAANDAVISGEDAFIVDSKIDDGLPATGVMVAPRTAAVSGCKTETTTPPSYVRTDRGNTCYVVFQLEYQG